jgi:hypothetical protein
MKNWKSDFEDKWLYYSAPSGWWPTSSFQEVGKAWGETTPARGRGFRAFRRSEVAFMKGIGPVTEAEAYRL